ncbi:hypothetical protein ACFL2Q_15280 [Thermodesulfobacteriota bacterium]
MRLFYSLTAILLLVLTHVIASPGTSAEQLDEAPPIREKESSVPLIQLLNENGAFAGKPDMAVENIPPLYLEPKMPGEGTWVKQNLSGKEDAEPLIYRTFYRPSEDFPTAIVYMELFNMKHISARLYLGSGEPYRKDSPSRIEPSEQPRLLAVTNALWQSRHAGRGGIILYGTVLKKMARGVAAIVVYKDESIDILQWNDKIPVEKVRDARQLKHLIVKDGKVVTTRLKRGKEVSAEIGLGSLLNEESPVIKVAPKAPGKKPTYKLNLTSGNLWFLATRSAFGVRPDGNLVFAVGHHIGTCDLAKALVLAGCVRGMHGDANPGNAVGILYFRDDSGKIVRKERLSPLQDKSTAHRYLKRSYPKDFFAFFKRDGER